MPHAAPEPAPITPSYLSEYQAFRYLETLLQGDASGSGWAFAFIPTLLSENLDSHMLIFSSCFLVIILLILLVKTFKMFK